MVSYSKVSCTPMTNVISFYRRDKLGVNAFVTRQQLVNYLQFLKETDKWLSPHFYRQCVQHDRTTNWVKTIWQHCYLRWTAAVWFHFFSCLFHQHSKSPLNTPCFLRVLSILSPQQDIESFFFQNVCRVSAHLRTFSVSASVPQPCQWSKLCHVFQYLKE